MPCTHRYAPSPPAGQPRIRAWGGGTAKGVARGAGEPGSPLALGALPTLRRPRQPQVAERSHPAPRPGEVAGKYPTPPGGLRGPQKRAISACPYLFRGGRDYHLQLLLVRDFLDELSNGAGAGARRTIKVSCGLMLAPDPTVFCRRSPTHVRRLQTQW